MSYPLSSCCDAPPWREESDICGDCKEHTDFWYPNDTYWTDGFGFCDHCAKQGYVHQKMEVKYDEDGAVEDEWVIGSLCAACADK